MRNSKRFLTCYRIGGGHSRGACPREIAVTPSNRRANREGHRIRNVVQVVGSEGSRGVDRNGLNPLGSRSTSSGSYSKHYLSRVPGGLLNPTATASLDLALKPNHLAWIVHRVGRHRKIQNGRSALSGLSFISFTDLLAHLLLTWR